MATISEEPTVSQPQEVRNSSNSHQYTTVNVPRSRIPPFPPFDRIQ